MKTRLEESEFEFSRKLVRKMRASEDCHLQASVLIFSI